MMADELGNKAKHQNINYHVYMCLQNSVNSNQTAKRLVAILLGMSDCVCMSKKFTPYK